MNKLKRIYKTVSNKYVAGAPLVLLLLLSVFIGARAIHANGIYAEMDAVTIDNNEEIILEKLVYDFYPEEFNFTSILAGANGKIKIKVYSLCCSNENALILNGSFMFPDGNSARLDMFSDLKTAPEVINITREVPAGTKISFHSGLVKSECNHFPCEYYIKISLEGDNADSIFNSFAANSEGCSGSGFPSGHPFDGNCASCHSDGRTSCNSSSGGQDKGKDIENEEEDKNSNNDNDDDSKDTNDADDDDSNDAKDSEDNDSNDEEDKDDAEEEDDDNEEDDVEEEDDDNEEADDEEDEENEDAKGPDKGKENDLNDKNDGKDVNEENPNDGKDVNDGAPMDNGDTNGNAAGPDQSISDGCSGEGFPTGHPFDGNCSQCHSDGRSSCGGGFEDNDVDKSFTFKCDTALSKIPIFGLDKLVMRASETQNCTLTLNNTKQSLEVDVNHVTMGRNAVRVSPARGNTGNSGEITFTIDAVKRGTDWVSWAVPDRNGNFDFSKHAYKTGTAWGIFIEVK